MTAIDTVLRAIQLAGHRGPECFGSGGDLRRLDRTVLHDDQHGTAVVALAALLTPCAAWAAGSRTAPSASRMGAGARIERL